MSFTAEQTRRLTGMVVPVYFEPGVEPGRARSILESTFADQRLFCDSSETLAVVDRQTSAESVLAGAGPDSPLYGIPLLRLDRNRGKTGAVRQGIERWLRISERRYVATRDCDGDHLIEDLPRLVCGAQALADAVGDAPLAVFGARPSLARPMNWEREEWELLTNGVIVDLVAYLLARKGEILDRRFWNGYPLDLQSGYRLYDRSAARLAVESLQRLPDEREIYFLACETLPFIELSLEGGVVGQVQRSTLVEQPVSSYAEAPLHLYYGELLAHLAKSYESSDQLLRIFDNQLVTRPAFFSRLREKMLDCRNRVQPDAPPVRYPSAM